jgi:hypothetical protein
MIDLTLVSMEELIAEINKRTDVAVVAYIQRLTGAVEQSQHNYHGGKFACVGLLESFKYQLLSLINTRK